MTPVLVWLLRLGTLGVGATAGARTLKKRSMSEQGKIERLREIQERNAAVKNLYNELGPGSRIITNPVEAWRAITGGVIDVSKLPDAARQALDEYNATRQAVGDAINRQGGRRQADDEEVGSEALAMIDSLDRRFGPYLKNYIIGKMGGANASFGAVPDGEVHPANINRAWISADKKPNPGMPGRKYLTPIWFRRYALQALADGIDPQGKVDILGQGVVIDDATADLQADYSAWIGTYSPSQSEISMLVQQKRIPDQPGFWDKVWSGIVGTFKEVLSLDFLINAATLGYAHLGGDERQTRTAEENKPATAYDSVTSQIKSKFGASEVLGWVGAGIDSQTGVTKISPNPKPMTPEEKRIAAWLASQYVVVPDLLAQPNSPDQAPWIIRMDLALCGAWPILDVVQWMGGVEGFERALIYAQLNNGEFVVGGSRDLYQKPGQLALRAMVIARRALAGIEDRYCYGAATLLSALVNRPDVAPSRTWLEWAANERVKGTTFTEMWSYLVNPNDPNSERVELPRNGGTKTVNSQTVNLSQGDAENQRSQGKAKLVGVEWQYGGTTGPKVIVPRNGSVYSLFNAITRSQTDRRVNSTGIAASFAIGTVETPPLPAVPRIYTKWGLAGIVPITGKTWVSDESVQQMAQAEDLEAMSMTPQGRDRLKGVGG